MVSEEESGNLDARKQLLPADLTNKVDVGSQPGTMWSLSSQKPGHGIAELRDDDTNMLWQ